MRLKLGVNPAPECPSVLVMAPEKTRSFVWTDWWRPTAQPFPASIDCKQQRLTRSRLSGRAPTENAACWDYRQAKFKVNGITTRFKLPLGKGNETGFTYAKSPRRVAMGCPRPRPGTVG